MSSLTSIKENADQVSNVAELYAMAEEKIKLIEHISGDLSIPAINELRYAGYHLVQHLKEDGKTSSDELTKAENHCKRAIYDAVEAGVVHQLELIKRFQEDFRKVRIKDVFPEYPKLRKEILEAKKLVTSPRDPEEERGTHYKNCSEHLEKLRLGLEHLEEYRDELIDELHKQNMRSSIQIAMLLLTAAIVVYAALNYHDADESNLSDKSRPSTYQQDSALN